VYTLLMRVSRPFVSATLASVLAQTLPPSAIYIADRKNLVPFELKRIAQSRGIPVITLVGKENVFQECAWMIRQQQGFVFSIDDDVVLSPTYCQKVMAAKGKIKQGVLWNTYYDSPEDIDFLLFSICCFGLPMSLRKPCLC
jgi:hypothetical protein